MASREPVEDFRFEDIAHEDIVREAVDDDPAPAVAPDDDVPTTPRATMPNADREVVTPDGNADIDMGLVETDVPLGKMLDMLNHHQCEEVRAANDEVMSIVSSLGGNSSKYRRERGKALRAIVNEIYPRRR